MSSQSKVAPTMRSLTTEERVNLLHQIERSQGYKFKRRTRWRRGMNNAMMLRLLVALLLMTGGLAMGVMAFGWLGAVAVLLMLWGNNLSRLH